MENRCSGNENIRLRVNAITGRGYNPSVAPKARQLPLHRGAEKRHQLLLCTPAHTAFGQLLCISPSVFCCRKAATKSSFAPSPPAAHASASLSRVRGRQRLAASLHPPPAALESQTPQREPRALPRRTQIYRRRHCAAVRPDLPRCETQHYNPSVAPKARQLPLHRGAENARHCRGALRRSYARRRRAALIRRGAGCAAPRHLPQGEGYVLRTEHRICRGGFCIASNSLFRTQKSALAGAFVRIAYSSGKGTRAV